MSLPYRYELMIRVEVEGDGLHADGDGAMGTAKRLAALLETDDRVIRANPWPDISYIGKTRDLEPTDQPRALGHLSNEAGAEAWRRGR